MKRKCEICGIEAEEYWMHPYNMGRRIAWLCWDCYKNSQYEASKSDLTRQRKLFKLHQSKMRNR